MILIICLIKNSNGDIKSKYDAFIICQKCNNACQINIVLALIIEYKSRSKFMSRLNKQFLEFT